MKSGLNEDTVIVLQQNGNVLFWNVPRNPCATGVANSTGPLTLTRNSFGSIYGCGNLAADVTTPDAAWQTNQLATGQSVFPNTLGNVQVKVCGELAPLSYANPMQVNFQVPADIPNGSCPVDVQTLNDDGSINRNYSGSLYIPIKPTSVGIFVVTHGVPTAGGYQLPTVGNPAVAGETLTIWSNGLGDVTEPVQTGVPAPSNRLVRTLAQPTVTIGGLNASVQFSGLAPSLSGAYQVNVQVPANLPSGPQTLKICMGDDCASVVLNQ